MPISNPRTKSRIFDSFPAKVQSAIAVYADEAELSTNVVITFVIAHVCVSDSVTFDNCQTGLQQAASGFNTDS